MSRFNNRPIERARPPENMGDVFPPDGGTPGLGVSHAGAWAFRCHNLRLRRAPLRLQRGSIRRLSCYAVHSYSISLQPCRCGNAFGRSSTKTARAFEPPTEPPNPGSRLGTATRGANSAESAARFDARRPSSSQAAGGRENRRHHGFADRRGRCPADAAAHVRIHRLQGVRGVARRMPRGSHPQEPARDQRGRCSGKLTAGSLRAKGGLGGGKRARR